MYRNGTSTTIPNRGIEPQRQDQIDFINEEPKELIFTFDPNVHIIESVTIDRDGPLEITVKRDAREKIDCGVIVDISSEGDSLALRCGFCRNDMILAASNIDAAPTICSGTMGCSYVVLTEVLSSERSHALLQSKKRPITFIVRRNINSSQTASAPTRALPTVPEKTDWQHLVDQQFRYANISDSDDSDDERDDPSLSRGVGRFDIAPSQTATAATSKTQLLQSPPAGNDDDDEGGGPLYSNDDFSEAGASDDEEDAIDDKGDEPPELALDEDIDIGRMKLLPLESHENAPDNTMDAFNKTDEEHCNTSEQEEEGQDNDTHINEEETEDEQEAEDKDSNFTEDALNEAESEDGPIEADTVRARNPKRSRDEERLEEGDDEEDDDDDDEDEDDDDDFVVDEDAQDDEEEETVPSIGGGSESSQATPSLSPHEVDVNELWGGKLKLGPFIVMSARSGHLTTKVKGK